MGTLIYRNVEVLTPPEWWLGSFTWANGTPAALVEKLIEEKIALWLRNKALAGWTLTSPVTIGPRRSHPYRPGRVEQIVGAYFMREQPDLISKDEYERYMAANRGEPLEEPSEAAINAMALEGGYVTPEPVQYDPQIY